MLVKHTGSLLAYPDSQRASLAPVVQFSEHSPGM